MFKEWKAIFKKPTVIVVMIGKRDRQLFQRLIQKFLLAFGAIGPKRCVFWGTPRQYAQ